MEIEYIVLLVLGVLVVLSIFMGSLKEAFGLMIIISGLVMTVGGFIYGIYVAITTKAHTYFIFGTFKYWKMYGKEIFTSHALFYGGIIFAIIGGSIMCSE